MFFREIFFLLFKYLRFDELKSRSNFTNKDNEFEELFLEIRGQLKAALEELGENLRPEEEAEEVEKKRLKKPSVTFTPEINERLRKLIKANNIFLVRINQLIENFEFSKKNDYQEDINILQS